MSITRSRFRLRRMSYASDEPGNHASNHYPDRPFYTRDAEDAPIEGQQRQFDKHGRGGIEEILDEQIQDYVACNRIVLCWNNLIVNAKTKMDPYRDALVSRCFTRNLSDNHAQINSSMKKAVTARYATKLNQSSHQKSRCLSRLAMNRSVTALVAKMYVMKAAE